MFHMLSELTKEQLKKELYQKDKTQSEIADDYDCSRQSVLRRKNEYDLPTLPSICFAITDSRLYCSSGSESVAIYQLCAIADGADPYDVFGEHHVHHIDGSKINNGKDNLIVLSPKEHGLVEKTDMKVDKKSKILYIDLDSHS